MLYLFLLSKCALSQENSSGANDNNQGAGTAGTGADGGGDTGTGDGYAGGSGENKAQQYKILQGVLETGSPEEIMARFAGTGNVEYIHYVERAGFESFGYERFNVALNRLDESESNTKFGILGDEYSSEDL